MWELFWIAFAFAIGSYTGQTRATNIDITEKTSYMQDLIDNAYHERDKTKQDLDFALMRVDMWQQRYNNLLEEFDKVLEDTE
jgi:hypothetical protein